METILVIGVVIAGAVWLWPSSRAQRLVRQDATALKVLDESYAMGEITRGEYLEKKDDILGYPLAP